MRHPTAPWDGARIDPGAVGRRQRGRQRRAYVQPEESWWTAAIERATGTPSEAFLPVLRNAVTQEYHHVEALKDAHTVPR